MLLTSGVAFEGNTIWVASVIIIGLAIQPLQFFIRKKSGILTRILWLAAKLLAATFAAVITVVTNGFLAWKMGALLAALYVVFIGDSISDILTLPYVAKKKYLDCHWMQTIASCLCIIIFLLYGTLNMQRVTANSFTVTSDKIKESYRVAFVSDMHVGTSQSFETTEKTISMIGEEAPDAVILGGDITDEFTTKEEMQKTYELFGALGIPVYFIYGNHDRQPTSALAGGRTYSNSDLEKALVDNGIKILEDEWIEFSEELVFLGRDDVSTGIDRIDLSEIQEWPLDKYVILLDHSPHSVEDTVNTNADFQLSGHTHAGQLFPLQAVYDISGYNAYGFYHHGNTDVYVSSGAGGWLIPFRSEAFCHYELVTFEPEKR